MFSRNILDQIRKTFFCMSLLMVYLNPISTRREGQILPTICRGCTKNFCSHTFLDIQSYNGAIKFLPIPHFFEPIVGQHTSRKFYSLKKL